MQTDLFQLHEKENNRESQTILEYNIPHFKGQVVTMFEALMRGEVITGKIAQNKYDIGDYRARKRDIKNTVININDVEERFHLHEQLLKGRYKAIYMTTNDRVLNQILIEKFNQQL